jgi:hypothetical protein
MGSCSYDMSVNNSRQTRLCNPWRGQVTSARSEPPNVRGADARSPEERTLAKLSTDEHNLERSAVVF